MKIIKKSLGVVAAMLICINALTGIKASAGIGKWYYESAFGVKLTSTLKIRGYLVDEGYDNKFDCISVSLNVYSGSAVNLIIPERGTANYDNLSLTLPIKEIQYNSKFSSGSTIKSISISDRVISIETGTAFKATRDLKNLENIYVSASNPSFCANDGVLFNKYQTTLLDYPQGRTSSEYSIPNGVTKIENYAFYNQTRLRSITIPKSVTSIGDYAFYCAGFLTIYGYRDSAAETYAKQHGMGFVALDPEPVVTTTAATTTTTTQTTTTEINTTTTQASTTEITTTTQASTVSGIDSYGNLSYKSIDEDNDGFFDYVSIIDCDQSATEAEIPDEIDGLPVASIGDSAFKDCESLASVVIPESVTSIGSRAFSNCTKLKSLAIPEGVMSVNNGVFENCKSLTGIVIPKTVTSIGNSAFSNCSALTGVVIPESVELIDIKAFFGCTGLKTIKISNPECEIYKISSAISDTAAIHGYDNSTAQAYAEKYNRRFISLNAMSTLNVSYAVKLRKWLVNSDALSEDDFIKCDLNYDGKLNVFDWIILKRLVINK